MKKSKLYGLIGSTLSSTILLLVLWFVVLAVPSSNENEGFLVSFGDSFDAGGGGDNAASVSKPVNSEEKVSKGKETVTESKSVNSTVKEVVADKNPTNQKVFTQTENSVSIAEQKEKERVRKEQDAIRTQQIETNKRIAEQKRKEQEAIAKANQVNGLFGNSGSGGGTGGGNGLGKGKGNGDGNGDGTLGNPVGNGTKGVGFAFNVGNRNYVGKQEKPNYPDDVEGKITVNITVDKTGKVTSCYIGTPTNISNVKMREEAKSAALRQHFTAGKNIETGSITYNYRLE